MIQHSEKKIKVMMVLPSWGGKCGLSEYTKALVNAFNTTTTAVSIVKSIPTEYLEKERPDLVHFQFEYSLYSLKVLQESISFLKKLNIPYVITLHSYTPELVAYNSILSQCPYLIVHNEDMEQRLRHDNWFGPTYRIIPMGIKTFLRKKEKEDLLSELGVLGTPSLGFMGFMHWYKGLIPLLEAVQLLKTRYPLIKCYIFSGLSENSSSGEFYQHFTKYFQNNHCENYVYLKMGFLPEESLLEYLSYMDINLAPYTDPGFIYYSTSAAVRTLLAAGRPVITSSSPFFKDLGKEVLKIEEITGAAISEAVSNICNNPDVERELMHYSQLYVQSNSWAESTRKHLELYRYMLN